MRYLTKWTGFVAPFILVLAFAAPGLGQSDPPPLVSWWPAEGTAKDLVGENNGTLQGNVAFTGGHVGQAFSLPGGPGDYVQVPNNASFEVQEVTVDAWVRASGSPGSYRYVVAKGASGCSAASYALYTGGGGGLHFYVFNGSSYVLSPNAGTGVWDGSWHHVAGTYDGLAVRLYVDGTEVGAGTSTSINIGYNLPTTNDLYIGTYEHKGACGTLNLSFAGQVDEAEIFNEALPATEIAALAADTFKLRVAIDIKPGSYPNSINKLSAGVIPVAVLSTPTFDATTIMPALLELGGLTVKLVKKDTKPLCHVEDVNYDSHPDLLCQVETYESLVVTGTGMVRLTAQTSLGTWVYGEDSVNIVKE